MLFCIFYSYFYLVFVGALNVGTMSLNLVPELKTNIKNSKITEFIIKKDVKIGSELGRFEMGSTVLAFFPKDFIKTDVTLAQKISFGQSII